MDILDNLWQAWGDPYGKRGFISVGRVVCIDVFCCIIIVNMIDCLSWIYACSIDPILIFFVLV